MTDSIKATSGSLQNPHDFPATEVIAASDLYPMAIGRLVSFTADGEKVAMYLRTYAMSKNTVRVFGDEQAWFVLKPDAEVSIW